jgi:RND superfamily putative drug exporter
MLALTRWTTGHRRLVISSWIAIAVAVLVASQAIGKRNANNFSLPNTDSQRAVDLLKSSLPRQAGDADQIVFRARTGTLEQASVRTAVVSALRRIATLPHVASVVSPYSTGAQAISKDGTIGFATVTFDLRANELTKRAIDRVVDTAKAARSSALQVELGGQAIKQAQQAGLGFVTVVGIAAAIVVLLISFGSFVAMGLPIVTALLGLGAGVGLIGLLSHVVDMVDFSSELALMIGLGVGIDYALFVVTRFRDCYRRTGATSTPPSRRR